jgi:hypothetical protein
MDVATAKSTIFGACICISPRAGSCKTGGSKNFPLKRKGNLRKTFICFHISTCPPECCFEDITVNFQNRKQSLFHVEIKVLFGTTRFGFVVRHPRAGHVFGSGIATLVVLATRFG